MATRQSQRGSSKNAETEVGVSNVTFDLLSILHNKLEAATAYEQYRKDARAARDSDVEQLISRVAKDDAEHIDQLRTLLADRLSRAV